MIDKIYIQKLRELDIMKVADALGMGIRNKRAAIFRRAAAGHRASRLRPATAVPERGIMADSPP